MKVCSKCLLDKEESEFNFSARHRYKLQSYCADCQKKYFDDYAPTHKEKYVDSTHKWRQENQNYKQIESLRKIIIRMLKTGGEKIHPRLGYSGGELRKYLGTSYYKRNSLAFVIPIENFQLPEEFSKAGALENIILK